MNPDRSAATRSLVAGGCCFLLCIVLGLAPWWLERASLLRAVEFAYYIALAQMWNLLAGYAGLMSIGQQMFVGIGAYVLYAMVIKLGWGVLPALLLAGSAALVIALPAALLLFRLRGAQFAIGSWVLAESVMLLVTRSEDLGGASGLSLPATAVRAMAASADERIQLIWWLALLLAIGSTLLVFLWLRSRQGLALTALRDNETAAAGLGVDTRRVKFAVYLAVAGMSGLIGALIFLNKLRISPGAAFSMSDWTASVIFIVVIGGIGSIEGPLLGALIFFALREVFAAYGAWYQILLGATAILVMIKAPRGVWGLLSARWGWSWLSVRRLLKN
ncbi:branched-chain amino acid ABC transporter permease [Uliginosibacterium sediminicola]|uniref:Branched-chain amino acid ABC transporter permease n=1 Tax=Uliginosibacterium sediminicola TaxID=2024550 RepID=A0ABU9YY52_9RHOO